MRASRVGRRSLRQLLFPAFLMSAACGGAVVDGESERDAASSTSTTIPTPFQDAGSPTSSPREQDATLSDSSPAPSPSSSSDLTHTGQPDTGVPDASVTDAAVPSDGRDVSSCVNGHCAITLATGQQDPYALAVDTNNLYWTNYSGGSVMALPLGGGTPAPIATGQTHPKYIAVDSARAYWADDTTVMSVALDGGIPKTLATGQITATGVAIDSTYVYWTNNYGGSVRKVPLDGGPLGTLAAARTPPRHRGERNLRRLDEQRGLRFGGGREPRRWRAADLARHRHDGRLQSGRHRHRRHQRVLGAR